MTEGEGCIAFPCMANQPNDVAKRRFVWGMLLAWSPIAFITSILLAMVVPTISSTKATGLGAVAGGFTEAFFSLGVVVTVVFEITGLVLLVRSFSKGHYGRAIVSIVSILCSGVMLSIFALVMWLTFRQFHR